MADSSLKLTVLFACAIALVMFLHLETFFFGFFLVLLAITIIFGAEMAAIAIVSRKNKELEKRLTGWVFGAERAFEEHPVQVVAFHILNVIFVYWPIRNSLAQRVPAWVSVEGVLDNNPLAPVQPIAFVDGFFALALLAVPAGIVVALSVRGKKKTDAAGEAQTPVKKKTNVFDARGASWATLHAMAFLFFGLWLLSSLVVDLALIVYWALGLLGIA